MLRSQFSQKPAFGSTKSTEEIILVFQKLTSELQFLYEF